MPLPKPNKGDTKDNFLDRCMGNDAMNSEYPDKNQRFAVCNSIWEEKRSEASEEEGKFSDKSQPISSTNPPDSFGEHGRNAEGEVAENELDEDGKTVKRKANRARPDQQLLEGGEDARDDGQAQSNTTTTPAGTKKTPAQKGKAPASNAVSGDVS